MPDPRQLLRQDAPIPLPSLVQGVVASGQPLPSTPADPVYVTMPNHSLDLAIPMVWAPIWGADVQPAAGALVLVAYDDNGVPYAVWWNGLG